MREIKFRAWDKESKYMFKIFDSTTQEEWFLPQWKDKFDIMQYIGLKDCNGKEIYHHDIIKETEYFNANYEVIYDAFSCSFKGLKIGDRDRNTLEFPQLAECGEVIGNIYENPNLLDKEE